MKVIQSIYRIFHHAGDFFLLYYVYTASTMLNRALFSHGQRCLALCHEHGRHSLAVNSTAYWVQY